MNKTFGSKALAILLSLCMTLSMLAGTFTFTVVAEENVTTTEDVNVDYVAKIGNDTYDSFDDALAAASAMTGDVIVEVYGKVTLNKSLSGSYDSISFVGKSSDAEIYLDVQGYITATGKKVAFKSLKLSKSVGGFITNAGFMNVAFGVYDVTEVTYTDCTFVNGAYASSGKVTFTDCTFYRSHDKYGLWAYGDVDVTVNKSEFADYRGIKMYSENAAKTTNLTVTDTDFSAVNNKPAIVLTYGESVTLTGNTYSSTGTFELDLDGAPNGVTVTSDVAPTCKNDNGACGVLVDGKIYTTVAQAAEAATSGSVVTLLHNSTETVVLPEGVLLDTNGFTADNVTATCPTEVATFDELVAALAAGKSVVLTADITTTAALVVSGITATVDLNGKTLTIGAGDNKFIDESNVTFKNGNICITGVTVNGNAIFCLDEYENTLVTTLTLKDVNLTGNGYSSAYGVFYIGASSVLNVEGGEWELSNDTHTSGGVFKADSSAATLNIEGLTLDAHNVRRVVTYAATTLSDSKLTVTGDADGVDAEMEHGFNRSPLTITNSTVVMKDMVGRGITAQNGEVKIVNSDVTITNVQEATIDVRNSQTVTIDTDSTVVVDVAPTVGSGCTISGTVVEAPNGNFVAEVNGELFETLAEALAAAGEGDTITILAGTVSEGTVKLPATLKNVTIKGEDGAVLKDMTLMAHDGNSICYEGITIDNLVFDNSNILVTGWRTNGVSLKDWTITNCEFKNIVRTASNEAAIHFNLDVTEALNGFTFTNNVIDGVSGKSNSGIYAAFTGDIVIENNVINAVAFRPLLVQLSDCDGVIDNVQISGNTFSGSSVGRVQIYGSEIDNGDGTWTPSGTDNMSFVLTQNIFKDITGAQQICTWGINAETVDISGNYYDIDITSNPSGIYWNNITPGNVADLAEIGIFPVYTELNDDGSIDTDSGYTPVFEYVAQLGATKYTSMSAAIAALKANGGTLVLLGDVNESLTFNYPADGAITELTIDLNGFTVTSAESTLWVSDGYAVTVKDSVGTGKIISTAANGEAIAIARGGKVILEGGYVYNDAYAVYLYSGSATGNEAFVMNGGTVEVPNGGQAISVGAGKATVNGGKVLCNKTVGGGGWNSLVYENGAMEITGGEFLGTIGCYGTIAISGGTFSYCDDPNDGFNNAHLAKGYSVKKTDDGSFVVYALPTSLSGSGTAEDPYLINNADDLKFFRDDVNNGNRYNGEYVKLNADIDLNDEEWTPIGDREKDQGSFLGTFDGGNHTIHNLWISEYTKTGAGFFSKVGLQTEYVSGTVKNVTFNNVTIVSSQSYVGVIAQAPLGALIENVNITGSVTISGYGYVGGIVGHGYPTINNCSVVAEGTITANYWGAGAILGFAGDHGAKINNATVEGIGEGFNVHATYGGAAVVAGSPYGAKLDGADVSDVTVSSDSDYCMGYIVAGGNATNVTMENVTATANGQPITPADVAASVNGTLYFTLAEAIAAAKDNGTVVVLRDVTLTETLLIPADATVTLDLNGKTISQSKACTASYSMITNKGTLTVTGNGKISFTDTGAGDPNFGWGSYTLTNHGVLVVENGTIENLSAQNTLEGVVHMYCAIQQGWGATSTTINGGTISTPTYRSVRVNTGALIINGGNFEGQVWIQPNQGNATVDINGGTFAPRGVDGSSVFMTNVGENYTVSDVEISGGDFTTKIGVSNAAALAGTVTGGNFSAAAISGTNSALLAPGSVFMENEDGSFTLENYEVKVTYKDGTVEYFNGDIQAAFNASGEVVILKDITLNAPITVPAGVEVTLDLNGNTVSYATTESKGEAMITNKGSLTVKDSVGEGKLSYAYLGTANTAYSYGNSTIENAGNLVILSGTVENTTAAMSHASYAINTGAGATLTVDGGKILNLNGHAIRMVSFGTALNTVTVNGGYIEGTRALQVQLPGSASANAAAMALTVNGGELKSNESTYNLAIYVFSNGQSAEDLTVTLNGGTFSGNVAINGAATTTMADNAVTVKGGEFNGEYGVFSYAETEAAQSKITIKGGEFATNYSEQYATDDGFVFEANEDGSYGVSSIFGKVGYIDVGVITNSAGSNREQVVIFAGIDALDYDKVGFEVTLGTETYSFDTTTVFTAFKAAGVRYTPADFGAACEYIFSVTINFPMGVDGHTITVRPYAVDGDSVVYGNASTLQL